MNLQEYIDSQKKSIPEIAQELGIAVSTLYSYYRGKHSPHAKSARKIEEMTKGAVSFHEVKANKRQQKQTKVNKKD